MIDEKQNIPLLPAGVSAAGLLFCLWVASTGGKELCLTDGCSLFQDFRIAGISLWHAGAAFFTLLLLLCLSRRLETARLLASLALWADAALLAVMVFTSPCANCLIVGSIIATSRYVLHLHEKRKKTPYSLAAWCLLFICCTSGLAKELAGPWSLTETASPQTRVWFSPSCPACRSLASNASSFASTAWNPVSENTRDIWVIAEMTRLFHAGRPLPEAIAEADASVPPLPDFEGLLSYRTGLLRPEMLLLQFRLWRNKAHVLASGSPRIPLVEFSGIPAFMQENPKSLPSPDSSGSSPVTDLSVGGFCSGETEAPCTDAQLAPSTAIDTSAM